MRYCLLFCCLLPVLLCGQVPDSTKAIQRLQVGVGYGMMDYSVDFLPTADVEPLRGNNLGLQLRYFDNKLVGFQAALNYVQAGWRETIDTTFSTFYERQTNYLEVQLLTQLSIGKGAVQPLLQAGPYVSFPLSEMETVPPEYVAPENPPLPFYYDFPLPFRINYGLQIGAGLNLELGPLTVQIDGRYLIGFSDLIRTGTTVAATSRRAGVGGRVGLFYTINQQPATSNQQPDN
ncbi:MAG: porin family protein [Bacteroidota bacterium]